MVRWETFLPLQNLLGDRDSKKYLKCLILYNNRYNLKIKQIKGLEMMGGATSAEGVAFPP